MATTYHGSLLLNHFLELLFLLWNFNYHTIDGRPLAWAHLAVGLSRLSSYYKRATLPNVSGLCENVACVLNAMVGVYGGSHHVHGIPTSSKWNMLELPIGSVMKMCSIFPKVHQYTSGYMLLYIAGNTMVHLWHFSSNLHPTDDYDEADMFWHLLCFCLAIVTVLWVLELECCPKQQHHELFKVVAAHLNIQLYVDTFRYVATIRGCCYCCSTAVCTDYCWAGC